VHEQDEKSLYDPERWGISVEKIKLLGPKLVEHWQRFRRHFKTKTRDTSEHALAYMRGKMMMESNRNFAGIANDMYDIESADGQAMQHFTPHLSVGAGVSQSPWSEQGVYEQRQAEINEKPELQTDGLLILDEYADEKSGVKSAGALR
jgi:hypothetical protein